MNYRLAVSAIALACLAVSPAAAGPPSNNPYSDDQYTCDFAPTDGIRLGRVYRVKDFVSLKGFTEKSQLATRTYEIPYADISEMAIVAGNSTTQNEKVMGKVAADYVATIGGAATKLTVGANKTKAVTISREIGSHYYMESADDEMLPAYEWFEKHRTTSTYKKNWKDWTYFIVREIRLADGMSVSINKDDASTLGVGAAAGSVAGASATVESTSGSTYSLKGKFLRLSTFCMKVERLS